MKNNTLQFLVSNMNQAQKWTPFLQQALQDLMTSNKLDIEQEHFDFLMKASMRSPEEVEVKWSSLNDTLNMNITWKIGENEDSFVTKFQPYVIN